MKKGLLLIKKQYLKKVQLLIKNKELNINDVNDKLISYAEIIENKDIVSKLQGKEFFSLGLNKLKDCNKVGYYFIPIQYKSYDINTNILTIKVNLLFYSKTTQYNLSDKILLLLEK